MELSQEPPKLLCHVGFGGLCHLQILLLSVVGMKNPHNESFSLNLLSALFPSDHVLLHQNRIRREGEEQDGRVPGLGRKGERTRLCRH